MNNIILSEAEKSLINTLRELKWGSVSVIKNAGKIVMEKTQVRTVKLKDVNDLIEQMRLITSGEIQISVQEGKPTLIKHTLDSITLLDTR